MVIVVVVDVDVAVAVRAARAAAATALPAARRRRRAVLFYDHHLVVLVVCVRGNDARGRRPPCACWARRRGRAGTGPGVDDDGRARHAPAAGDDALAGAHLEHLRGAAAALPPVRVPMVLMLPRSGGARIGAEAQDAARADPAGHAGHFNLLIGRATAEDDGAEAEGRVEQEEEEEEAGDGAEDDADDDAGGGRAVEGAVGGGDDDVGGRGGALPGGEEGIVGGRVREGVVVCAGGL